jgi:thiol:disulfide interchange protein DsbD
MSDPLPDAVIAVLHADVARWPVVALAGLVTSLGPCVAPRYVALATLLGGKRRVAPIAAFVAGIVTVYAALGLGVGLLAVVTQHASLLDSVLAFALISSGLVTLLRPPVCDHVRAAATTRTHRLSGIFTLGAASGLVVSPCCTPMLAAVAAFPALDVPPFTRGTLLAVFALGHSAPLLATGLTGAALARRVQRWSAAPAAGVVSGTLLIALGAYYGVLV